MLTVTYSECHIKASYAECRYSECRYAERRYAECRGACLLCCQLNDDENLLNIDPKTQFY
jgi:hypothetical protein